MIAAALLLLARSTIPGADPTGVVDSSAALNAAIRVLCNATCVPSEHRGGVGHSAPITVNLDLEGGVYRLTQPIAVNSTVACTGKLRIHDGTLLADPTLAEYRGAPAGAVDSANHSFLVTVLDWWNGLGFTLDRVVFASNGTGGGVRVDAAHHVHILNSQFVNFATVGIWGSALRGMGHDLVVDGVRMTECTGPMSECADIAVKKATAILIEFPDSHFRNSVITCGFRGIVNRAGANNYRGLHIWTSCTGAAPFGFNTTIAFADETGSTRVNDCYFDNAIVAISGYRGTLIANSYFNGGSRLVLAPPVKVERENHGTGQKVAVPLCADPTTYISVLPSYMQCLISPHRGLTKSLYYVHVCHLC